MNLPSSYGKFYRKLLTLLALLVASSGRAQDADEETASGVAIKYESEDGLVEDEGHVVVQAQDGGILFENTQGELVIVQPDKLKTRNELESQPPPVSFDEMETKLLEEFGEGFRCHRTDHFLLCYNTTDAYAKWNASLFERLYRGFYNYWRTRRITLEEPKYPLVALVFENRESYLTYARAELGNAAESMIGYYALMNNRIVTFDLTGMEANRNNNMRMSSMELVNQLLSRPEAERTVATIVHEAVHQISYNSGLQVRLAENPLWVSEGLATFFETPDFSNGTGWGGIGKPNKYLLMNFRATIPKRTENSIELLICDDRMFRDPATSAQAYAECWALTYFLQKVKTKEYAAYLDYLSSQKPLGEADPKHRIEKFKEFFGEDLAKLEKQFIKTISSIR